MEGGSGRVFGKEKGMIGVWVLSEEVKASEWTWNTADDPSIASRRLRLGRNGRRNPGPWRFLEVCWCG